MRSVECSEVISLVAFYVLLIFILHILQHFFILLFTITLMSEAHSARLLHSTATATAKSLQSCLTLCDPIDGSPPGSPTPGILQARTLEWVAISFSNAWKWKVKVKSLSCVRLHHPMDCSPPGSSVHGIFQARVGCHCLGSLKSFWYPMITSKFGYSWSL